MSCRPSTPSRSPVPHRRCLSVDTIDGRFEVLQRHDRYYLEDGVVFEVQNILFKIPRYMLVMESPVFEDMFQLPKHGKVEGNMDTAPIRLSQVEILDFERLLELLYPLNYANFSIGTRNWAEREWTSILHLASRWQMENIRSQAIAQLSSCAASASKVTLGRKYDYPPWIRDGFIQLCLREEPLAMEQAGELTLKEVVGVAHARERMRSEVIRSSCDQSSIMTKYGESHCWVTQYHSKDSYKNRKAHQILDEIFDIQESLEIPEALPVPF